MRLSYSKLSAFERCPFLYRKIYIEKAVRRPKTFFSFGLSLHKVLEKFYSGSLFYKLGIKKPTKEYLLKLLNRHWVTAGMTSFENAEFLNEARGILEKYYDAFIDGLFQPAWRVEAPFNFRLGKHEVRGYIDRIDSTANGFEIIDYKTNMFIPDIRNLKEDLQLQIYFTAAKNYFHKKVDSLSYIFLRFNKKISFAGTAFNRQEIEEKILRIAERISGESDFPPKRNIYCRQCDFRDYCGMFAQ